MSGVLIAAALALVALCAAAIGAGRRRRRWRTTGSGGGRGGAAGGDATGGSESGVGERGNNRRRQDMPDLPFLRSSFSIALFSIAGRVAFKLQSQAFALPAPLLAAAFAIRPCFLQSKPWSLR
jgi:hypothetical protein